VNIAPEETCLQEYSLYIFIEQDSNVDKMQFMNKNVIFVMLFCLHIIYF